MSKTAVVTRTVFEPTSPFVPRVVEDHPTASADEHDPPTRAFFLDLLAHPSAVVDRIIEREELDHVILKSLGTIVFSTTFYSLIALSSADPLKMFRGAGLSSLSILLALAAAFGPIYAASLLLAARIPLARLVGIIVSSAATGSLILAACAPIPFFLLRVDRLWAGPIAMVAAFLLSGLISGARIYRSMHLLAEKMTAGLTPDGRHRVGTLARIAWMLVGFTLALALWSFDALI